MRKKGGRQRNERGETDEITEGSKEMSTAWDEEIKAKLQVSCRALAFFFT